MEENFKVSSKSVDSGRWNMQENYLWESQTKANNMQENYLWESQTKANRGAGLFT